MDKEKEATPIDRKVQLVSSIIQPLFHGVVVSASDKKFEA